MTSAQRLRRLLALVPYVVSRQAVGLSETAATFGMTERELIDDLNLAWCVELKSPEPYCPIDLSYEDGQVTSARRSRSPARCGWRPTRRARSWSRCGCWARRAGQRSRHPGQALKIAKIEAAAGAAAAPSSQVTIQIDHPNASRTSRRDALARRGRVHLRYYVPVAMRQPSVTWIRSGCWIWIGAHLPGGWCRLAEGVRNFRLDRVLDVKVLDLPAEVHEEEEPFDGAGACSGPSEADVRA